MKKRKKPSDPRVRDRAPPLNLASVDLNLLIAFDAMLKTGSVTRAAGMINRSQSAVSHMLTRLRRNFGDELFVRDKNRFVPTARAEELATLIEPALASLRLAFEGRIHFDPATTHRHFTIGMPDIASFSLLPLLMPAFRSTAPHATLSVLDANANGAISALASGQIEFGFGFFPEMPPLIVGHYLITLSAVGIADRKNPRLRNGKMDRRAFLSAPHVANTMANDPAGSNLMRHLSTLMTERHVVLQVPHYFAIPAAIRGTDMVATIDRFAVPLLSGLDDLAIFELPIPQPNSGISLIWHQRHHHDPGHRWLRQLIIDVVAASAETLREPPQLV